MMSAMYSAEVLSQLRSLNWLAQEVRRVPAASPEGLRLQEQIDAVRTRLPSAILVYHDNLAARGKVSAAQITGDNCGVCHLKLPRDLVGTLALPGRFGVCVHCGVFLWSDAPPPPPPDEKTRTRRKTARSAQR